MMTQPALEIPTTWMCGTCHKTFDSRASYGNHNCRPDPAGKQSG